MLLDRIVVGAVRIGKQFGPLLVAFSEELVTHFELIANAQVVERCGSGGTPAQLFQNVIGEIVGITGRRKSNI